MPAELTTKNITASIHPSRCDFILRLLPPPTFASVPISRGRTSCKPQHGRTNVTDIHLNPKHGAVFREVLLDWMQLPSYCLLYTSPSPRDGLLSRMPSS